MKIVVVTQARVGSTRLPGKVLKKIGKNTLLDIHLARILKAKSISDVIVATTLNKEDDLIEGSLSNKNVTIFRGKENDVLDRYYQAVKKMKPEYVVRLTSDCPLIDPKLIDFVVEKAINSKVDYCSNTLLETFPDGQDIEVFTFESLENAWRNATLKSDREHVTPYIKNNSNFNNKNKFRALNIACEIGSFKNVRMTVDEENDFKMISLIINKLGIDRDWIDYTNFYLKKDDISSLNRNIIRNEGYLKSLKND